MLSAVILWSEVLYINSLDVFKWTKEEVEMMHEAVRTFSEQLNTLSSTIKQRTVQQIR